MQVSPEDRTENHPSQDYIKSDYAMKIIALLIGLLIVGGLIYYVINQPEIPLINKEPEPLVFGEIKQAEPTVSSSEPAPEIPSITEPETTPIFALPTLDESDVEAKKQVDSLTTNGNLSNWFHIEHLVRRGVTFIDGLSRGLQLNKMHKAPTPKGKFLAMKKSDKLWLNRDNYQRYGYLINVIQAIDSDKLVKVFHQFRPLLEEAYGELGHSPKKLDNAVISALDQILSAPINHGPIELTQESVQYKYANPNLEALPPIQKQLLRMGPENTQIIQNKARLLREKLL